ncbi:MAG: YVTN family beta-propeller repeat-containing protein, partial [Nitrososphaerales archaeon]
MHSSRMVSNAPVRVLSVAISLVLILVLLTAKVSLADSVTSTVSVGTNPEGVALDPTNGYLYVANFGSGTVSVIDGSTNTVVTNVTVGVYPIKI